MSNERDEKSCQHLFGNCSHGSIAAEVAAPLAKTDEIVLLGGADKTTTEVNKLLGQLPPAVQALTGVDLSGVISLLSLQALRK